MMGGIGQRRRRFLPGPQGCPNRRKTEGIRARHRRDAAAHGAAVVVQMRSMKAAGKQALRHALRRLVHGSLRVAPLRHGVRSLARAGLVPRDVWTRLPVTDATFAVALPGGPVFLYRYGPGDAIGHAFYWRGLGAWESATIRAFLVLARQARMFLDVGANTGAYTLLACAQNPSMRALAYEPVPRIHERLVDNIALNGFDDRCTTRQVAVADAHGTTELHVPLSLMPSSASLARHGFRDIRGELVKVEVTTADRDTAGGPRVDLVKIDVEGFEDRVLAGMPRILSEDRPVVICECNPDGPHEEVEAALRARDYVFFHLCDPRPVEHRGIVPDAAERYRNYACVPAENTAARAALLGLAGGRP